MLTPDRGALRLLRSGVLAVCTLGLSALAHALAGGHLPGAGSLAALAAGVGLLCWAVGRWRLSARAVTGLLGAGQVALHAAFAALAPQPGGHGGARAVPPGLEGLATGAVPGALRASGHSAAHAAALWVGGPTTADAAMLLAHAAAAVALGLVVARGESALWDLCAWLAPLAPLLLLGLLGLLGALPARPTRRRPATGHLDRPRVRRELSRLHRRRGPPRLLAA